MNSPKSPKKFAQDSILKLASAHTYPAPIVTQIVPLQQFYPAETHHQNYLALHSDQPYIVIHDKPKLEQLRKQFPAWYQ
jgi:peptide-methionine (S)-S-oxide reductase